MKRNWFSKKETFNLDNQGDSKDQEQRDDMARLNSLKDDQTDVYNKSNIVKGKITLH